MYPYNFTESSFRQLIYIPQTYNTTRMDFQLSCVLVLNLHHSLINSYILCEQKWEFKTKHELLWFINVVSFWTFYFFFFVPVLSMKLTCFCGRAEHFNEIHWELCSAYLDCVDTVCHLFCIHFLNKTAFLCIKDSDCFWLKKPCPFWSSPFRQLETWGISKIHKNQWLL